MTLAPYETAKRLMRNGADAHLIVAYLELEADVEAVA